MERENKCMRAVKYSLNYKTGAVVGGLAGLIGLSPIITEAFRNSSPIEYPNFKEAVLTVLVITTIYSLGFQAMGKVTEKINNYFDRLARK